MNEMDASMKMTPKGLGLVDTSSCPSLGVRIVESSELQEPLDMSQAVGDGTPSSSSSTREDVAELEVDCGAPSPGEQHWKPTFWSLFVVDF